MRRTPVLVAVALVLALGTAACGTDDDAAAPTTVSRPAGKITKVSANDASEDEIAAALTAVGVANADHWADEVAEYRPYPQDDPTLAKLRDELAKYNPGPGVVDAIISALEP